MIGILIGVACVGQFSEDGAEGLGSRSEYRFSPQAVAAVRLVRVSRDL